MYSFESLKTVTLKLLGYCQTNDWAGYDPYDSLNSQVLKYLPFLDFRLFRLGLTQMLRRSPFNFRPVLLVPKTQNPKAIALFLMAFLKLKELGLLENEDLIMLMTQKLIDLRSPNNSYWCWGYSFPWQTRRIVVAGEHRTSSVHLLLQMHCWMHMKRVMRFSISG